MAWDFFKLVVVPALSPWLIWASFSLLEMWVNRGMTAGASPARTLPEHRPGGFATLAQSAVRSAVNNR